jgi:predicted GNAT superfamily acetyltransferase
MKKLLTMLRKTPPIFKRILFRLNGRVVTLKPRGVSRGNVLLSYITTPFTLLAEDQFNGHTNYWETRDMARAFLERGYSVDVIDKNDTAFIPKKDMHASSISNPILRASLPCSTLTA